MSYIYVINQSDDPKACIALFQHTGEVPDMDIHAWMVVNIPIGSKARLNASPSYGIFISYYSSAGNILFESEVIPITNGEGTFRVVRSGREINLVSTDAFSSDNVLVEIDRNVERLIRVNIVRDQLLYFSFFASPGCVRHFTIPEHLFINKVKPELIQGNLLPVKKMLLSPSVIHAGQTAILVGTANLGYDFIIRNAICSDFISL
jgi:hypothetical protein